MRVVAGLRGRTGRAALLALAAAFRDWAVAQPHVYLLIQGTPLPGFTPPDETVAHARAVLGPFLPVFAKGRPRPSVDPLVDEFRGWLRDDTAVAAWVEQWTGLSPQEPAATVTLTGTVTAWPQMHGTVSLGSAGQFAGMGHRPETMLAVQVDMLADSFQLA
ncbi:TetR-like C-terminal domain-containing protein [Micromonospora sp. DH14]|uniref:TetR-like C-terminal domain-containing protein n=1 Tax=Micromonospora sp. DH14 TaxID=3040120 RepID=UPI002441513B|nr:TetR-like C-terminal domain-containing protein [Micromonospora sp. DH14]MDG9678927.1 TetR-like C-terminal domain-containing protein [Micromonospora sp. DH14]